MNVKLIFEYDLERKGDWHFVHLDRTLSQIELRCIAKLYEGLTQVVPFAGTAICRKTCSSWLRHSIQKTAMITSMHAVNPIDMRYLSQQAKGAKGAIVCDTLPLQHWGSRLRSQLSKLAPDLHANLRSAPRIHASKIYRFTVYSCCFQVF